MYIRRYGLQEKETNETMERQFYICKANTHFEHFAPHQCTVAQKDGNQN